MGRPSVVAVFDSMGTFVRTIGRVGAGPGEYRSASGIGLNPGDTVAVYDFEARRISVFSGTGAMVRSVATGAFSVCCAPGGGFLIGGAIAPASDGASRMRIEGAWHITNWSDPDAFTVTPTAAEIATLPRVQLFRGKPLVMLEGERQSSGFYSFAHPLYLPFHATAEIVFAGPYIINSMGRGGAYRMFDMAGRLVRTVDTRLGLAPVTPQDLKRVRDSIANSETEARIRTTALSVLDSVDLPDVHPGVDRIIGEDDGSVWVRAHDQTALRDHFWMKFDSTGRPMGNVTIRSTLRLLDVRGGRVVTVEQDSLSGLQRLLVFEITRSPLQRGR
jgi:hypothetical protein